MEHPGTIKDPQKVKEAGTWPIKEAAILIG